MEAQLFNLDAMRSKQRIRTLTEKISYLQMASAGSALMRSAMSFWAEYVAAMASFHASLLNAAFSPSSKRPMIEAKPRNWL